MRGIILTLALGFALSLSADGYAADRAGECKREAIAWIDTHRAEFEDAAKSLHDWAEVALTEHRSSKLLADLLEKNGFTVERGVAGMPTAFTATYGSGKPVIGILAEYDALPGLSQKSAMTVKEAMIPGGAGHGCGHSLYGPASVEAALAMKTVMEKHRIPGTVKLFGCPAEETMIGKIYMAKAGMFTGLDVCMNWHPSSENKIYLESNRAMDSFEVSFRGKTAHASVDPWDGRSALDAVELMNTGVNFLREHVRESVRIHYVIADGGMAPNIVPDYARVWYFVRDSSRDGVEEVTARVIDCAKGAALMAGTTVEVKKITGSYNYLPNRAVSEVMQKNLQTIGAPEYTADEQAFARAIQKTLGIGEKGMSAKITPLEESKKVAGGSTDVSDVSWLVPTNGEMAIACIPAGSPGHSWAIASSAGASIGFKGMQTAAKVIAASGIDLLLTPADVNRAKAEFAEKTKGFTYRSAIPDGQKPPLPQGE